MPSALPFPDVERRLPLRQAATNANMVMLPSTTRATAPSSQRIIVPTGETRRRVTAKVAILHSSGVPTTRPPPTVTHNVTSRRRSSNWLRTLVLLRSSKQRFANIGSTLFARTLQQKPQPEPQTFVLSFRAVGAYLV